MLGTPPLRWCAYRHTTSHHNGTAHHTHTPQFYQAWAFNKDISSWSVAVVPPFSLPALLLAWVTHHCLATDGTCFLPKWLVRTKSRPCSCTPSVHVQRTDPSIQRECYNDHLHPSVLNVSHHAHARRDVGQVTDMSYMVCPNLYVCAWYCRWCSEWVGYGL